MLKSIKVVTGIVRFSYVNVFYPINQGQGKLPKYSCALIIPKSDVETIENIRNAISQCKTLNADFWGEPEIPNDLKGGLKDGDLKSDAAYHDCWFLNASSPKHPGIVDANLVPITNFWEFYSGCYGRASLTFYVYNNFCGNRGIGCSLNNVQKLKDGPRLGNAVTPVEDFA